MSFQTLKNGLFVVYTLVNCVDVAFGIVSLL